MPDAYKATAHVKKLERRDHFGLRERIGGPFRLTPTYDCARQAGSLVVVCAYDARGNHEDADGFRMACTINVRVRPRPHRRIATRRVVKACAPTRLPALQ